MDGGLNWCEVYHFAPLCFVHFPEIGGFAACTMHVHNTYTTTFQVMYHRRALVELYQCTYQILRHSPKVSRSKDAYVCALCYARALCNSSSTYDHRITYDRTTYHRITHIELHQCTKVGVASSKFPRTGEPLSNKVFRSWRVQPASHENDNQKSVQIMAVYV